MKERKVLLIVGDGMADRPIMELNGKTPLEYAYTPNIDMLAREGVTGLLSPIKPGIAAESDAANLALLGYDPRKNYLGRGVFEALGLGVKLKEGELAFRVNLATVEKGLIIDRRAGRFNWDKTPIAKALNNIRVKGAKVKYYPGVEHRGVLIFSGKNLSKNISGNDPHKKGVPPLPIKPLNGSPHSSKTAELVDEFLKDACMILSKLEINYERRRSGMPPANYLLIRGPGLYRELEKFSSRYGLDGCIVAGFPLVKGVGVAVGLDVANVSGATGKVHTNYTGKAKAAVDALSKYSFVYLHFKAPDTASHDGNYRLKVEVIERIDEAVGKILNSISLEDVVLAITADHATPVSVRDHTGDLVPFLIRSSNIVKDEVNAFSEKWAYKGGFNTVNILNFIRIVLNYALKPPFLEL